MTSNTTPTSPKAAGYAPGVSCYARTSSARRPRSGRRRNERKGHPPGGPPGAGRRGLEAMGPPPPAPAIDHGTTDSWFRRMGGDRVGDDYREYQEAAERIAVEAGELLRRAYG